MDFSVFKILFYAVPIFVVVMFVFTLVLFLSPKLRGKIMARQIKATKHMLDFSKEDLESMAEEGIDIKKNILDRNEDKLREMSIREANISKESTEIKARAIKDGLTKDKMFCKYCGNSIDEDSKFCKHCGKKL